MKTISFFDLYPYWSTSSGVQWPPTDIVNTKDNMNAIIYMALAGFSKDDITIELKDDTLFVSGTKENKIPEGFSIFGAAKIAQRSFKRQFTLAENVVVTNIFYENGLLEIHLELKIPEEKKAKRLEISSRSAIV